MVGSFRGELRLGAVELGMGSRMTDWTFLARLGKDGEVVVARRLPSRVQLLGGRLIHRPPDPLENSIQELDEQGEPLPGKRLVLPAGLGALAVTPDGGVLVGGLYGDGPLSFGGKLFPQSPSGNGHMLVAKGTGGGAVVWAVDLMSGTSEFRSLKKIAVDVQGDVLVLGIYDRVTSSGLFLVRLDGRTGAKIWEKNWPGPQQVIPGGVALDGTAVFTAVAAVGGPIDLGGGARQSAGLISRFDGASGAHVWSTTLDGVPLGLEAAAGRLFAIGLRTEGTLWRLQP